MLGISGRRRVIFQDQERAESRQRKRGREKLDVAKSIILFSKYAKGISVYIHMNIVDLYFGFKGFRNSAFFRDI